MTQTVHWKTGLLALAAIVLLLLTIYGQTKQGFFPSRPAAQSAATPSPSPGASNFMLDSWNSEDGLPQNSVLATARTKEGYLWIGTQEGVTRFDGVKFKVYKDTSAWANQDIFTNCLLAASDGSLWVGTRSGLNRIKDDSFTTYTIESGLPNKFVTALAEDASGAIWVGTRGGLAQFSQGRFTAFTNANGLADEFIVTLQVARNGSVWIGTGKGLSYFKDGRFENLDQSNGFIRAQINKLYEDRSGALWIGTEGYGLIRFKDGKPAALTTKDKLSNNNVYAISEDSDGRLWIGTGDGVNYLEGGIEQGRLVNYSLTRPMLDDFIYSIYPDHEGSIWIGTKSNGLVRLRKSLFTIYGAPEGLSKNDIWCVLEARDGSIWTGLGAGGGLNRLKDGKVQAWTTKDGLIDGEVLSLHEARDGSLWVGTAGGLCHFQNGRFTCFTTKDGLPNDDITAFAEEADGTLWIGTYAGVSHYKDGKFDNSRNQQGLGGSMIGDLLISKFDGSVWFAAMPEGLFRLKDGELKNYSAQYGLPSNQITSIYEDAAGDLWIGTYQMGLKRVRKDGRVTHYTTRDGLPEEQVFDTLEDDFGNFWLTSNHGIFRLAKQQFDDFDQGKTGQLMALRYGISDGLRTNECNGGSQPSGWKTRDGRLLITTINGLVVANPGSFIEANSLPTVVIEQVMADKKTFSVGGKIEVGPGLHDLEIAYTGLSLLAPGKLRFKYRLEGFDDDWISVGARRTAYYTSLPPGDYRFQVIAANAEGRWNETGATISLRVKPQFYQKAWFFLLCAVLLTMVIYGVHRYHVARSNERLLSRIAISLPTAMAVIDGNNSVRLLNNQFVKDFGYTTNDLPTMKDWFDQVYPDLEKRQEASEAWENAPAYARTTDQELIPRERRIQCKDGSSRDVEIRSTKLRDRIIITLSDVTMRKRAEEELKNSHQQLRDLAARLQQAREEERAFIAREIHDELGQLLTGLKFDIKWLEKRLPQDAVALRMKTASVLELVDESIQALRRVATEFRPGILDTLGLTAAIEWQAREFQNRTGIECKINEQMPDQLNDRHRETALFRIFQESLTNVARHSGATEVKISLSRQNGSVVLQVRDNGKGITEKEIHHTRSIGLLGMRERAHLFGGEVRFSGAPNHGTTVTASIPLETAGPLETDGSADILSM